MSAGTTFDINTFPQPITPADVGRRVAAIQGIDWDWRIPTNAESVGVVEEVQPCYSPAATMVRVSVAGRDLGWYTAGSIRLIPDECRCVLPEQSCPACRAAAREAARAEYGEDIPY